MTENTSKFSIYDFKSRTDNKYFPNTEKDWEEFLWKVHFMGGKSIVFLWYLADKERLARKNEESN
jgi:hypothetical protein